MSVDTIIDYPDGAEIYSNSATSPSTVNKHVEKLWAQHRITSLLRMVQLEGETPALRAEIVCLGMGYGIIVEGYTALLITTDYVPGETATIPYDSGVRGAPTYATTTTTTTTATTTAGSPPQFDSTLPFGGIIVLPIIMVGLISIVLWRRRT